MKTQDVRVTIQEEMRAAFPAAEQRVWDFYAMQEYHLGWRDVDLKPASFDPGKLLRPQLSMLACQLVGGDIEQAMPLAAGIQLIHDFTLIHDDIEDDSDTRRGRTTVWKQWGIAHGINAGDAMFVVAHLALHRMSDAGVAPAVVLEVLKRFDQTILTICEGQFLDLSFEGNLQITEADYLSMISRKTAALLAAAAGLGGIVGGADQASVQCLFDFGQSLGLAFQIQDDVIGIWGEPSVTGKPRAADIYRRKVSLPVVHALSNAENRNNLMRIYRQQEVNDDDVGTALAVLENAGSREYSEGIALHYHKEAVQALERVCVADTVLAREAREKIQGMLEKLLGRQA
jgi:geranylgeranyl diphosphate synthase type I